MTPLQIAIEKAGGPAAAARLLGVSVQAVCFWRDGLRAFPAAHAAQLERAQEAVCRWHLFPNDWHLIWPELIGAEGAPAVPAVQQAA